MSFPQSVTEFMSENFPYVDAQSLLWNHFALAGFPECVDTLKLLVGKYHCKCDLTYAYKFGSCSSRRKELIDLVKLKVTSAGICPVHPGRKESNHCCQNHAAHKISEISSLSKGARRREQRKRAKARKELQM